MSVSIAGFGQADTRTVNATPDAQTISFMPLAMNQALRQLTVNKNSKLHVHVTDAMGHLYY